MPILPIFYEWEISDSHRNIIIVKTELLFVDLIDNLISNNFFCVKMDFRFRKKMEQLARMQIATKYLFYSDRQNTHFPKVVKSCSRHP